MNKQKFVEYLRSPESISASQFEELEQLLVDYPYFSIAKSVAARASKNLNSENKNDIIASAAIYATDRRHLKRYVNGEVIFLADAPKIAAETKEEDKKSTVLDKAPEPKMESPKADAENESAKRDKMQAVHSDVDQILDELHQDMEELKKSRLHFVEIQNQLDEEVPNRPLEKKEPSEVDLVKPVENKEDTPHTEEAPSEEEIKKEPETNITNLIDSLKKEFEEDDLKEKSKATETKAPLEKPTEEKKEKPKKKTKAKKADSKKTITKSAKEPELSAEPKAAKTEEKETPKPEPPKKERPAIVTNMDDGDEDEETTVLDPKDKPQDEAPKKKEPARASRGERQKVKREDLEKLMGIAIKPATIKEEKPEEKKEEIVDKKAPKKAPAKKKTAAKKETKAPVKESTTDKSEKTQTPPNTEDSAKEKPEPPKTESTTSGEDETASRSSARAFLDFGGTGDMSSSVSRASSSRRKRSTRSSKSNGDAGEKKGGDDDDKSGPKDLIEKFISENPSIQRRSIKGDKSDLSEKSTEWQPDVASEYLAEIYLKQGNKLRAIQIYEALMLKFPEKKSYFAALIEKVQG